MPNLTLQSFLSDEYAYEMYLTGRAGTGKTTALHSIVEALQAEGTSHIVCAFTHKACGVLRSKLPPDANIATLDSFLRKRPGINNNAVHKDHVDVRLKMGDAEDYQVIIIDEYSMVGEKDYMDIIALQDGEGEDGKPVAKVIYVGDPYQLLPVKDAPAIHPSGAYWVQLTTVHRTDKQDLLDLSTTLISYISREAKPQPLNATENFVRGVNLVRSYNESDSDKILLAWTNKRVQELNFIVAAKDFPETGDELWDSTRRHELVLLGLATDVVAINTVMGELLQNTKFRTLEFLAEQPYVQFFRVNNITLGVEETIATHFGTYNYKQLQATLTEKAVVENKKIETKHGIKASDWCKRNKTNASAKHRAQAWRRLLSFKEATVCTDFRHATTIHKSQGSTYSEVYLDSADLSRCAEFSVTQYARLFYVAVTRATTRVFTN